MSRFLRRRGGRRYIPIGDLLRGGLMDGRDVTGTSDVERAVYSKYHIPEGTVLDATSGTAPLDPAMLDTIIDRVDSGRIPGWSVPQNYLRQAAVRKWNKGHPWQAPLTAKTGAEGREMDRDLARYWSPMNAWASLGFTRPSEVQQFGGARLRGAGAAEDAAEGAITGYRMVADAAKDVPIIGTVLQASSQFLDWINAKASEEANKARMEEWQNDQRKQAGAQAMTKVLGDWEGSWGATGKEMFQARQSRDAIPTGPLSEEQLASIEAELPSQQQLAWQMPKTVMQQLAVRYWNANHPWEAPLSYPPTPEQLGRAMAAYPYNYERTRPSQAVLDAARDEAMANWHYGSGRRRRFHRRMHGAGIFDVALSIGKKALPQIVNFAANNADKLIKPALERIGIHGDVANTIASHGQRLAKSGASKIDYSRFW